MTDSSDSKYSWEEWQLTAYLLGELEPDMMAEMAAAAEKDPQLAAQLKDLSKTLDDVKAVLNLDGTAAHDQAALSALKAGFNGQPGEAVAVATFTLRRLVTRWENWLSLAGLILIGVLLYQRPGSEGKPLARLSSGPASATAGNSDIDKSRPASLDATVVKEAWDQTALASAAPLAMNPNMGMEGAEGGTTTMTTEDREMMGGMSGGGRGGMSGGGMGGMPGGGMPGMAGGMLGGSGMGGMGGMPGQSVAVPGSVSDMAMTVAVPYEGMMAAVPDYGMTDGLAGLESEQESRNARFRLHQYDPQYGDRFARFADNEFQKVDDQPLSTFSIDVDTASYAKTRQFMLELHRVPPPAAVRIEEFINYFDYEYPGPKDDKPFAASLAVTECPWQPKHQLVRIALQAKQVEQADRPKANLVFLLDVSGSMNEANKLPLVKETMRLLTYQLTENDKVAMVVYAGAAGCVLESTYGHEQDKILSAIERLNAGGSTNGASGIQLAYKIARENFISGGINRVILCTDGDFNVGVTNTDALVELVKEQAQSNVFLTVLGYGNGNTNDAMMEQIADRGNGLYGFVDSRREAQRQMVKQLVGNLMTVAKDVKVQVEFNPNKVRSYRLIGYENRKLATEDFNNDKKDAGEIGAGHRVTALYELVPVAEKTQESPLIDGLRYQANKRPELVAPVRQRDGAVSNELPGEVSNELLAVKLRYKQPEGSESQLLTFPLEDKSVPYAEIDKDFRWAAAMAEFGMLLRRSPHKGQSTWSTLVERARGALGTPVDTSRAETLEMINVAVGQSR